MTEHCPICSNSDIEILGDINNYPGQANFCNKCNTVFPSYFPSDEEINCFYQGFSYNCQNYSEHLQKTFVSKCRYIENMIRPWQTGNSLLDFGGGGGLYSKGFMDIGYHVKMTEIDDEAIKNARNLGVPVYDTADLTDNFDIVFSSHVIEHFKNPHDFFRSVNTFLKKDGLLIIATPNKGSREFYRIDHLKRYKTLLKNKSTTDFIKNPWWCFYPPRHFYALSAKSLEELGKSHGFRILSSFSEYSTVSNFMHNDMYSINYDDSKKPKSMLYKLWVNVCSRFFSILDKRHGDNLVIIMKKEASV